MATTHCPDCSSKVSTSAVRCPSCGRQLRHPARTFFLRAFGVAAVVVVGLIALGRSGPPDRERAKSNEFYVACEALKKAGAQPPNGQSCVSMADDEYRRLKAEKR